MKHLILSTLILTSVFAAEMVSAQTPTTLKKEESSSELLLMHENMAKMHSDVVACLKSGKAEQECVNEFHEKCLKSGMMGKEGCGSRSKMTKRK